MNAALWLHDHGIHVFPTFNKVPAVPKGTSQFDYRCTREQAARFREYGVPLGLFAVADSDAPKPEAWVAAHLPETPFKVTTGRGRHRYYRLVGDAPHFFHRDGLTIEFRHHGQYVVGSGSVRPDGVTYTADDWSWNLNDVPVFPADFIFDDRPLAARGSIEDDGFTMPAKVSAGERHDQLFRLLRSCKGSGFEEAEAREIITMANQGRCDPPLVEDEAFEKWIRRAWRLPDRPFPPRDPFAVNVEAF